MQKQAADLARPVVLLVQAQQRNFLAHANRFGFEEMRLDVVGVKRLKAADLRDDPAGADDGVLLEIFHHEQVSVAARPIGHVREGALRSLLSLVLFRA